MNFSFLMNRILLWKASRTPANFTFSTRYPAQRKDPRKVQRKTQDQRNEHVPARLKLDDSKSRFKIIQNDPNFQLVDGISNKPTMIADFGDFGFLPEMVTAIKDGLGFKRPSNVQSQLINLLAETKKHILCGSHTGSGKTLAYLAPVMNSLKLQELSSAQGAIRDLGEASSVLDSRINGRPRAVILVPSRHLVLQITRVAKVLSHHCRLRVLGIHSRTKYIGDLLGNPVDVLVTTPASLGDLIFSNLVQLSKTNYLIIDEADTVFDKHYEKEVQPLVKQALFCKDLQFVLVTATVPKPLDNVLAKEFKSIVRITTPTLHQIPQSLKQYFFNVDRHSKANMLLEVIKKSADQTKHMIVFCNDISSVDKVCEFLNGRKIKNFKMHSKIL